MVTHGGNGSSCITSVFCMCPSYDKNGQDFANLQFLCNCQSSNYQWHVYISPDVCHADAFVSITEKYKRKNRNWNFL